MPELHELICPAIDKIPLDPGLQRSNIPPQIPLGDSSSKDVESERPDLQEIMTSAPILQEPAGFQRKRPTATAVLQEQLAQRDGNSEALNMLPQELERQRQVSKGQLERQLQESKEQLVSRLTDTISALVTQPQEARKK